MYTNHQVPKKTRVLAMPASVGTVHLAAPAMCYSDKHRVRAELRTAFGAVRRTISSCGPTWRTSSPIGDIIGQPKLAHKAAAEVAAGRNSVFDARVIPSVAYTDPGGGLGRGDRERGRSLTLGRSEGLTKVLFDDTTGRAIGCGIVGPSVGDLIAEAALAIEMGAGAADIALTIRPHPTLSE